jgi:hypothetical protein
LLKPEETVLIRAYSNDTNDRMLTEIKPKFIVMFEPDMDFVRRVVMSKVKNVRELCGSSLAQVQKILGEGGGSLRW